MPNLMVNIFSTITPGIMDCHLIIEQVHAMKGQGVTSVFDFGMGFGLWLGIINALQIPYTQVTPQKWKKEMMQGIADKDAARVMACRLFPMYANQMNLVKHHGRAEALLMAEYGRRQQL